MSGTRKSGDSRRKISGTVYGKELQETVTFPPDHPPLLKNGEKTVTFPPDCPPSLKNGEKTVTFPPEKPLRESAGVNTVTFPPEKPLRESANEKTITYPAEYIPGEVKDVSWEDTGKAEGTGALKKLRQDKIPPQRNCDKGTVIDGMTMIAFRQYMEKAKKETPGESTSKQRSLTKTKTRSFKSFLQEKQSPQMKTKRKPPYQVDMAKQKREKKVPATQKRRQPNYGKEQVVFILDSVHESIKKTFYTYNEIFPCAFLPVIAKKAIKLLSEEIESGNDPFYQMLFDKFHEKLLALAQNDRREKWSETNFELADWGLLVAHAHKVYYFFFRFLSLMLNRLKDCDRESKVKFAKLLINIIEKTPALRDPRCENLQEIFQHCRKNALR